MRTSLGLKVLVGLGVTLGASPAAAGVLAVPDSHPTIQAAVDAAQPGDKIFVRRGSHCGAVLDKPVHLIGLGYPTIVGCDSGPFLAASVRVGFLLPGANGTSAASGSTITGFSFDGAGVSNTNLAPLAFGIVGRFANNVGVLHNRFQGTVQAITNTAGDRWLISHNRVEDLSVFDCTGSLCTGGDGIVVQVARGTLAVAGGAANPVNRPEGNLIVGNRVDAQIPDGFDAFGFVGVLVFAADGTTLLHNKLSIPDNPEADAPGQGILITNVCCGDVTPQVPGARNTLVAFNDASDSEFGVVVEGTGGQNTLGLVVKHNRGLVVIEGVEQERRTRPHFPRGRFWKDRWF
ncbi:MAG TPA: hypothetical protein VK524_07535 [Polyangiaceae bacterium]|nr:hypothetical protein [Polyangiaceae bacterium]